MTEFKTLSSVKDLEKRWGLSCSSLFHLVKSGRLQSGKIGSRRVFTTNQINAFESSLEHTIADDTTHDTFQSAPDEAP